MFHHDMNPKNFNFNTMGEIARFYSNKLKKEVRGDIVKKNTYSVLLKLEDGNIIKKKLTQLIEEEND